MKRFYDWCLNKVRWVVGAVAFLLPRVTPTNKRQPSRLRKALLRVLFAILAGAVIFSPTCYATTFGEGDFTYTGTYTWVPDGGVNFRLKCLSGGEFVPLKPIVIDVFLVGGGGGGRNAGANQYPGGGGAGGLTGTWTSIYLSPNQTYTVTIGNGGAANGGTGGTTSFSGPGISTMSKAGGTPNPDSYARGGNGGSGGGGGIDGGGNGGSDGSDGTGGAVLGQGQGTTTREFGEAGGDLYAGGGGNGGGRYSYSADYGLGGAGGGGNGGSRVGGNGVAGTANTGGGGGGGGTDDDASVGSGAAGGSGICIIRNHR